MRLFPILLVLFAIARAAAAAPYEITIAEPRMRIVGRGDVRVICRTEKDVNGCTEFLGEVLRCDCRKDGDRWSIAATAQLVPNMYLVAPSFAAHEHLHFDDLRAQIADYLAELSTHTFPSRQECARVAAFEETIFTLRMDLFRDRSNEKLH